MGLIRFPQGSSKETKQTRDVAIPGYSIVQILLRNAERREVKHSLFFLLYSEAIPDYP